MPHAKPNRASYLRAYRAANKERLSAGARARYQANKTQKSEYYQTNREQKKAYARANKWGRKASECKRLGIPFNLPREFFENTPTHCPQCGVEFTPFGGPRATAASVDRNDPALGYVAGNCEWLCGACNRRKADQSWTELLAFAVRGMIRKVSR